MRHNLKIYLSYAEAILDGRKTFEIRYNDRGFHVGDEVVFSVIDSESNLFVLNHPLNDMVFCIDYVFTGSYGLDPNYCVFSIRRLTGKV